MNKTMAPLNVIPINGRVVGHKQELHPGDIIDRVVFVPIPNKTGTISQLQPCVQQALWKERFALWGTDECDKAALVFDKQGYNNVYFIYLRCSLVGNATNKPLHWLYDWT